MPIYDAFGAHRKNDVMKDTWGHMYPEGTSKHDGYMVIAIGEYGDNMIVKSRFPTLQDSSPQRFEVEHSIFDKCYTLDVGVYTIECTLWFFKNCDSMYLGDPVGKIIKCKKPVVLVSE